jgi:hypothetical protein
MRVRHTIAAGLASILLIQSAALAQTAPDQEIRTISHERGVEILLANLLVGSELRIDLANGDRLEGRLVDKSDHELIVEVGQQRRILFTADIVGIRAPIRGGMSDGKAFGIGTGIGFGAIFGWFLVVFTGFRL